MQRKPSLLRRIWKIFQINRQQLAFGSYAAELSFYIVWSIAPILLGVANIISLLPFSQSEILQAIRQALPLEVEEILLPTLESYLRSTSSGVFSISVILAFWPVSNVFSTLKSVLNTIYKCKAGQNLLISRLFSYFMTLLVVILILFLAFAIVFGENLLNLLREVFSINIELLNFFVQQSWLIGFLSVFVILMFIYYWVPNVDWPLKYAVPGSAFAAIGFSLISQLFNLYLFLFGGDIASGAMGVFIVLIIWLYLNAMVIAMGAYLNVFIHDFHVKNYWHLMEETKVYQIYHAASPNFDRQKSRIGSLKNYIEKSKQ